jgi:esterase
MVKKTALPEASYITIDNLKLQYYDWGNGTKPVLLFLVGAHGHPIYWSSIVNYFKDKYHCIALTARGHAGSQWADPTHYTTQDFVTEQASFIDALNIKKLFIIGASLGGRHGAFYAATHPERVDKLIISDMPPEFNTEWKARWKREFSMVKEEIGSFAELLQLIRGRSNPFVPEEKVREYAAFALRELPGGRLAWKHDTEMEKAIYRSCFEEGQAILLGRKPEIDWWYLLTQVRCPTLIIRGDHSTILDHETIQKMVTVMSKAEMVEIEGTGHIAYWDKPDEYNKIVERFLSAEY